MLAPFQSTTAPEAKLVPIAVSVRPAVPAVVLVGEIEASVGAEELLVGPEVPLFL
ncbi:MAG: hypothetical protein LAP13_16755 [Acidobacteriia bacterium]|nr:hypothetical protein [Terriglobia bacterium]